MDTQKLKNSNLSLVTLKGTTKKKSEEQKLIQDIIVILRDEIPYLEVLKNDISLIDNICLLVENYEKKHEIDKKQIATQVMISIFPELNNNQDLELISKNIDSIVDLSKNIKKIGLVKKNLKKSKNWFIKKFG